MKFVASFAAAVLASLLTGGTLAAPSPNDCSPNFQGQAFWVRNEITDNRWAIGLTPGQGDRIIAVANGTSTTFRAESNGGWPSVNYVVKCVI